LTPHTAYRRNELQALYAKFETALTSSLIPLIFFSDTFRSSSGANTETVW
jgi:hypothetical protein